MSSSKHDVHFTTKFKNRIKSEFRMKPSNGNGETKIEVLKCRIDDRIRKKEKTIEKIEDEISEIGEDIRKLKCELEWFTGYQKGLKQKREMEDINCFKEIMKIHKEILKITGKTAENRH